MDRKKRIALLVDYISSEYSEELMSGVSEFCKQNNVDLLIFGCGELKYKRDGISYQYLSITSLLSQQNIDGIIFTSGTQLHSVTIDFFKNYINSYKPIPAVNVSNEIEGIPSIIPDFTQAMRNLMDYMIEEQKCKKLLLMGVDSQSSEVVQRTEIFYDAVKRHNIPAENVCELKALFNYQTARKQLDMYIKTHSSFDFDAIVCLNDDMAFGCIDFCRSIGLSVPDDIIISGFDNLPRSAFSYLTLSTICQQLKMQGYKAAQNLLRLINGRNVPMVERISSKAILRSSTKRFQYYTTKIPADNFEIEDFDSFEINSKFPVYEWYVKRNQLFEATKFYTDIQQDLTVVQLKKILNTKLKEFGITTIAIVIYETPIEKTEPFDYFEMPHKAQVLSAFDLQTDYLLDICDKTPEFDPNERILPENMDYFIRNETILISLFQCSVQYGYMVFQKGSVDLMVYDLLTKTISSIVGSVFSFKIFQDEKKRLQDRWIKTDLMASTDQLTGIKNRRYFYDVGYATMTFADTVSQEGVLIYCDMDGLKAINDTYGHDSGDEAIKAEAAILQKNFRNNDIVARIAGDEFAVICQGLNLNSFKEIKRKIDRDCEIWTEENKSPFKLSISMGPVNYPSEKSGYDLQKLLSEADIKLYQVKKRKKANKQKKEKL